MAKRTGEIRSPRMVTGAIGCLAAYFALQALAAYFVFRGVVEESRVEVLVGGCAFLSALLSTWGANIRAWKDCAGMLCLVGAFLLLVDVAVCRGCDPIRLAEILTIFAAGVLLARESETYFMRRRKRGKHRARKK